MSKSIHIWVYAGKTRPGSIWGDVRPDYEHVCKYCGKKAALDNVLNDGTFPHTRTAVRVFSCSFLFLSGLGQIFTTGYENNENE